MRILIASPAFPEAARVLRERLPDDEVMVDTDGDATAPFEVVIPLMRRIDAALMDRWQPRLIQQYGVGLEGVELEAARERGIVVANVGAALTGNADGVGELAIMHLLALTRNYHAGLQTIAEGRLGEPTGRSLVGSRIVVLGLGAVGRAVAARLRGFRADVVGVGTRDPADAAELVSGLELAQYLPVSRLNEALAGARALIVCCVLNERTRGLIGREQLDAIGPGGYLVNVARGPVVDRDALLDALRGGRLAGAGLDVYWTEPVDPGEPLLSENVTATPHLGGVTDVAYRGMAEIVVANIERLRRGESIAGV